jgi:hypothetical protein
MATTGTTTFNLNLNDLIEEAWERASGGGEIRSGYEFRTARRSLSLLLLDWANQGLNLWTIDQGTVPLVAGTATYDMPEDTVDLIEHVLRTGTGGTQSDLSMTRISVSTYSTIPNKTATGRPIQIYIDRQIEPKVTVWPVPDASGTYTLVYWRMRRLEDAGNGTNTQDVPFRFMPCLVAGLAYQIAQKIPEGTDRLPLLKMEYDEAWTRAATEDRDRASVSFVPANYG